jgi:HlyD family secretion protein
MAPGGLPIDRPNATTGRRRTALLSTLLLAACMTGLGGILTGCQPKQPEVPVVSGPRRVSALGRIEPETKIRKVAVSSSLSGDRIQDLLVEENQLVKKGQPLAILNSYGTLKASLQEANTLVAVAQSKLNQVKAGAKQGEIRAQEYKVQSLQRRLAAEKLAQDQNVSSKRSSMLEAKTEAKRYDQLFQAGGASELQRDRYRTRAETTVAELSQAIETREGTLSTLRAEIESAKQTLDEIAEVRPVDVATAESELRKAVAARDRAQQEFSFATVLAPQDGQILKIVSRPGDKVSDSGILEMADTRRMVATAEVYQTDMPGISIGQKATITADGFNGSLIGTVYQINRQVVQQSIFSGQPGENQDQRVFEVKIRIDPKDIEERNIKSASNLQVNVVFDPQPPATPTPKPER